MFQGYKPEVEDEKIRINWFRHERIVTVYTNERFAQIASVFVLQRGFRQ